tara:strand:- start:2438 stop:3493 length:1056 start_codon:yes stop_codon:yes gene_type:complete
MSRGLKLEIDLNALRHNCNRIQNTLPNTANMGAAVKADAYGLGVNKVAPLLYQEGIRDFFVARIGEADVLNNILPHDRNIYILDGLTSENDRKICQSKGYLPVINSFDQAARAGDLPIALHIDTGMNRLGIRDQEANDPRLQRLNIKLLMTHAASADVPDSPQTQDQYKCFEKVRKYFPGIPASFANSAASLSTPEYACDMARPGIALYGGWSLPHTQTGIRDVVSLSAPVLQIRKVMAGEAVGYGAQYIAARDMDVATLGIGYADGLFRNLGDKGIIALNGKICPMVGRISMDLTTVDISNMQTPPTPGQHAEIIGPNIPLQAFAEKAGTIGYEVLTRLGKCMEKCYSGG